MQSCRTGGAGAVLCDDDAMSICMDCTESLEGENFHRAFNLQEEMWSGLQKGTACGCP